jgi:hypothetical protein
MAVNVVFCRWEVLSIASKLPHLHPLRAPMRQLENVPEELAAAYFSTPEVVAEKFTQGISGENPYWEDNQRVSSLSDLCIRAAVRCSLPPHLLTLQGASPSSRV